MGGISRTVDYKGFLFDIGGHRFFSKSKEVVELWQEILPDDFIERPRLSRIYYNGKFYSYPLKAFEALLKLGVFTSAACMLVLSPTPSCGRSRSRADIPPVGAQPVRRAAVPDLLQDLHREGVGHVVRRDFRRLGGAAHQGPRSRRRGAQRAEDALAAARRKPKAGGAVVKTLIESFQYPRKGPGMMWEAAARKIQELGGQVLNGPRAEALRYDARAQALDVEVALADGGRETYTARHVVSLGAAARAGRAIKPAPISLLHARALRYRDFLTVALMVQQAGPVPRQLDLHPRSVREGRPRAELPLLVARNGAGRHELPRPGIFLLRGRRPVERARTTN